MKPGCVRSPGTQSDSRGRPAPGPEVAPGSLPWRRLLERGVWEQDQGAPKERGLGVHPGMAGASEPQGQWGHLEKEATKAGRGAQGLCRQGLRGRWAERVARPGRGVLGVQLVVQTMPGAPRHRSPRLGPALRAGGHVALAPCWVRGLAPQLQGLSKRGAGQLTEEGRGVSGLGSWGQGLRPAPEAVRGAMEGWGQRGRLATGMVLGLLREWG